MLDRPQLPVRVEAFLHPLRQEAAVVAVEAGPSIAELLGHDAAPHVQAYVGAVHVPREMWRYVRPKAGVVVTVRVLASGGNSDDPNKTLRTVLQVVVLAASIYVGGLGFTGAAFVGAAIAGVGGYAVNALLPPPVPQNPLAGDSFNRLKAITGTQNVVNPFGVVPRVYGKHRIFPPFAAKPYTETVGDESYFRALFCLGYGPLNITEIKIGETPIDNFEEVEYEVTTGASGNLYRDVVHEEALNIRLEFPAGVTHVSEPNAKEISLDFLFFEGMAFINDDGDKKQARVSLLIEFRLKDSGDPWVSVRDATGFSQTLPWIGTELDDLANSEDYVHVDGNTREAFRGGVRWKTPTSGQYEVRVTYEHFAYQSDGEWFGWFPNTDGDGNDSTSLEESIITTFRTIEDAPPTVIEGLQYFGLRIKATDQLNGIVDSLNCVAESILQVWDGAAFSALATHNPAWIFLDIACGTATERALDSETRFDLDALKDWADENDTAGREYNAVIDSPTTVFSLMRDVAAVGRAAYANRNGLHTVVRDIAGLTPTQLFTPRNSSGFTAKRSFSELPHAFRVRYVNPDKGYQQDEFLVYDDGYSSANAENFEVLELRGVTIREQAFKEARYHLASRRLRAETFSLTTDVENLACQRGDLVLVQHDSIAVGLMSGRVKRVDGADLELDTAVTMESGGLYSMVFRLADGSQELGTLIVAGGTSNRVTLTGAVAGLAAGDVFAFGETGSETVTCKVNRIIPGADFGADLVLVPEAPDVYLADLGLDDDGDSGIPTFDPEKPPTPKVYLEKSDESVLLEASDGSLQSRIVLFYGFLSANRQKTPVTVEGRYQQTDTRGWKKVTPVPARAGTISFLPVEDGLSYDIQLRSVAADGSASPWTSTITHLVIGKTSLPPDVASLFINGDTLNWAYPMKPKDFAGFLVKYHAGINSNWEDAIAAHSGLVSGPPFLMQNVPAGQRTIMVKGVDQSGNESANPAILITDFGDVIVDNVAFSYDYAAAGFPGTITNGSVFGGQLIADVAGVFWDAADDSLFWSTTGSTLFWTGEYLEMTYEFSFTPDADLCDVLTKLVCEPVVSAQSWSMEFRLYGASYYWAADDGEVFWGADASLFWDEDVGEWQPWPGTLQNITRQQYDFRIITAGGFTQGIVSELVMIIDMPDVVEYLGDIALDAAGTRLPITENFRAILNVSATLQSAGTARTIKIIDKDLTGPLLQAFDSTGTGVDATIDATVQGY